MNWNGELSPQEYVAALSPSPAAKWYVDLCEQVERERYEESQRAMWQSSFAPWRGPSQPPNLRDNPLTPDLDAHELELARGTTIEGLNDAIDRAAGAFGLFAQHTRDVMDAIASATQIPARFLFGDPPTSLSYTVVPDAPAWSTEYQGVPTEPPAPPRLSTIRIDRVRGFVRVEETDDEYRDRIRAVMYSRVAGRSRGLPIIDDVEVEGKW